MISNRNRSIQAAIIILLMAICILPGYSADKKGLTVTFVPDDAEIDAGDRDGDAKGKSYIFYGNQSDHIVSVGSTDELLKKLERYNKHGIKIEKIYIVGHGGDAKNPSIDMGSDKIMPNDFDISFHEKQIQLFKEFLKETDKKKEPEAVSGYEEKLKLFSNKLETLKSVSEVMSPNAEVYVISCELLASDKGKEFATNMGDVLLGGKGGTLYASPTEIEVEQMLGWFHHVYVSLLKGKEGYTPFHNYYSIADWEIFKVSPIDPENIPTTRSGSPKQPVNPEDIPTTRSGSPVQPKDAVAGSWTTDWGALTLKREGKKVTGRYSGDNGEVIGEASGNVFEGYWIEDHSNDCCDTPREGRYYWGKFRMVFNGDTFTAEWGYCEDALDKDPWKGWR